MALIYLDEFLSKSKACNTYIYFLFMVTLRNLIMVFCYKAKIHAKQGGIGICIYYMEKYIQ